VRRDTVWASRAAGRGNHRHARPRWCSGTRPG